MVDRSHTKKNCSEFFVLFGGFSQRLDENLLCSENQLLLSFPISASVALHVSNTKPNIRVHTNPEKQPINVIAIN